MTEELPSSANVYISDGNKYQNINKTQKVKKLEKRKCRLQRSISRKYEKIGWKILMQNQVRFENKQ